MKMPHAGQLKRNITLKQPVESRDAQGGKVKTFQDVTEARAKITGVTKRVSEIEPALLNADDVIFRYSTTRSAVTKDWIVNYDGLDHVIHSVEFLGTERNEFIKLVCKANG